MLILALYTGTGAIVALEHALNRISGVTEEPNWLAKRVPPLKWLVIFGCRCRPVDRSGSGGGVGDGIFDGAAAQVTGWILGHLTGIIVGVILFAAAYRFLPGKSALLA